MQTNTKAKTDQNQVSGSTSGRSGGAIRKTSRLPKDSKRPASGALPPRQSSFALDARTLEERKFTSSWIFMLP